MKEVKEMERMSEGTKAEETRPEMAQPRRRQYYLLIFVAACMVTAFLYISLRPVFHPDREEGTQNGKIQVTGTGGQQENAAGQTEQDTGPDAGTQGMTEFQSEAQTESAATAENPDSQTEPAATAENPDSQPEQGWMDEIFGENRSGVSGKMQVKGLTQAQRDASGFRESDFVRAAGQFLLSHGIRTGQITFGETAEISGSGTAYLTDLDGAADKKLCVIMYAEYPGEYLFVLLDAPAAPQIQTEAQTERVQIPVQTFPVTKPQTEAAEQDAYNAADLHITGIPKKLHNYLNNEYEMQYSLYDYLYRHGLEDATSAAVTGYEIDADNRQATITFLLSDGSNVTGTYRKDENSYTFR